MGVNTNQQQTADWDELEYVLTERQKPALLVCSFDTLTSKTQSIAEFQQRFPQFTQHEIDSTGERVVSLFRYLKEKLPELAETETGNIQHLIHLSGLEYSLMAEDPVSPGQLLPELNFERELVFRDLPCILVIWVNQYTLKRLQKEAPDFWDWVQYRYHFSSPPELVDRRPVAYVDPLQSKGFTPERLARVEEMEARYNHLDQSGDDREQTLQNMANLLETLGRECLEIFEGEKAVDYFTKLLAVRERLDDQFEMAAAYFYLGEANRIARHLERAVQYYTKSIRILVEIDHLENVAANYHQIGMVYEEQRIWDKALLNYHKAIEWKEKTQQLHQLGSSYHHIGRVYEEQRTWDKALLNYRKAIEWNEKTQQLHQLGSSFHQIGMVYEEQRIWDKALLNYRKAIEWKEKTQQLHEIGDSYHQIGMVYQEQRSWDKALLNYRKAIEWYEKTQQLHQLDVTYACTGLVYKAQGQTDEAKTQLQKALSLTEQYNNTDLRDYIQKELDEI
jgi:tetratricopeptide (TPR) repeat protein